MTAVFTHDPGARVSRSAARETARYLRTRRDQIVAAAAAALGARPGRYARTDAVTVRARLDALYARLLDALDRQNVTPLVTHARRLAAERFNAGYDLLDVQAAFNVLEESIWSDIIEQMAARRAPSALSAVSLALGTAKDALARDYVALAASAHAPAVDLEALARGVERP